MGNYVDETTDNDVSERLPYLFPTGFTTSTTPVLVRVNAWIDEGEGKLNAALTAINVTTPVTDANAIDLLAILVADYVEGRIRILLAASGGDSANEDGRDMVKQLQDACKDILDNPSNWLAMMGGSNASGARLSSLWTDSPDGETIADGDFDPQFEWDQDW